jgi:hypothetical protein
LAGPAHAGPGPGRRALRELLSTSFNWPLFLVALALMAAPIADAARQLWLRQRAARTIQ